VFVDSISSATNGEGDQFTLRVDGDVKVGGQTVIKSGSIAVDTVTNARKRGYMGKAGELNVILSHVTVGGERIKLRASKGKTSISKPAHR
jgi:two-component sensor histidine kinase